MEDVIHEGITYKAVSQASGSCKGCAFSSWCSADTPPCDFELVIFVKKEEEPEEVFDPPEYVCNGEVYLPKRSNWPERCNGCTFLRGNTCASPSAPCLIRDRTDKKSVIFVRKPDTTAPTIMPSEPIKPVRLRRRIIIPD